MAARRDRKARLARPPMLGASPCRRQPPGQRRRGRRSWGRRLVAPLPKHPGLEVLVEPQRQLITPTATYRADLFVAIVEAGAPEPREQHGPICIEVDGHAHPSGKDRMQRDRRRDRDLVAAGIRVVRFAGSEVFHSTAERAEEIEGLVTRAASDASIWGPQ